MNFSKQDHADFQALFGVKFPTRFQILHQDGVDLCKETGSLPAFKVQIADLGGAVAGGDRTPREAMALFPKDAIEDAALVERGTAASARLRRRREEGLDEEPLFLGDIHFLFIKNARNNEEQFGTGSYQWAVIPLRGLRSGQWANGDEVMRIPKGDAVEYSQSLQEERQSPRERDEPARQGRGEGDLVEFIAAVGK